MDRNSLKLVLGFLTIVCAIVSFYLINNKIDIGTPDADGFTFLMRGSLSIKIKWFFSLLTLVLIWTTSYLEYRDKYKASKITLLMVPALLIGGYIASLILWPPEF